MLFPSNPKCRNPHKIMRVRKHICRNIWIFTITALYFLYIFVIELLVDFFKENLFIFCLMFIEYFNTDLTNMDNCLFYSKNIS